MNLAKIVTRTLFYLDDRSGRRFRRPEILEHINSALNECYQELSNQDEDYFLSCFVCRVRPASQDLEFPFPADFEEIHSVTDGSKTPMSYTPYSQRAVTSNGLAYYVRGNFIGVHNPTQTFDMNVSYIRSVIELVDDDDVPEIPVSFHDLVCLKAALACFGVMNRNMPRALYAKYQKAEERLVQYSEGRTRGDAVHSSEEYSDPTWWDAW